MLGLALKLKRKRWCPRRGWQMRYFEAEAEEHSSGQAHRQPQSRHETSARSATSAPSGMKMSSRLAVGYSTIMSCHVWRQHPDVGLATKANKDQQDQTRHGSEWRLKKGTSKSGLERRVPRPLLSRSGLPAATPIDPDEGHAARHARSRMNLRSLLAESGIDRNLVLSALGKAGLFRGDTLPARPRPEASRQRRAGGERHAPEAGLPAAGVAAVASRSEPNRCSASLRGWQTTWTILPRQRQASGHACR